MELDQRIVERFADVFWGWNFVLFGTAALVVFLAAVLISNTGSSRARFFGTLSELSALVLLLLLIWFSAAWPAETGINWWLVVLIFWTGVAEAVLLLIALLTLRFGGD